jgi:hypothetical protein
MLIRMFGIKKNKDKKYIKLIIFLKGLKGEY